MLTATFPDFAHQELLRAKLEIVVPIVAVAIVSGALSPAAIAVAVAASLISAAPDVAVLVAFAIVFAVPAVPDGMPLVVVAIVVFAALPADTKPADALLELYYVGNQ